MGRYYNGDINGKFWFGLQSSDAASRFGGNQYEPQTIKFEFNKEEDLEKVEAEIAAIERELGEMLAVINKFFTDNNGWNDEMLKAAGISKNQLSDYADLGLGKQIKDCLIERGECSFDCEL